MNRARHPSAVSLLAFAVLALGPAAGPARAAPPRPKRLLIIAPERFHHDLADYARHKRRRLSTDLVSLEKVLRDSPGVDAPERLKRYLYEAWKERDLGYVLLVGDADMLPVRYMVLDRVTAPAFDYAFYPSDLYYADLAKSDGSFDDWNGKKDGFHAGYFGEVRGEKIKTDPINYDAIDYRPDVAVGRWPVSSPREVRIVVEKTMKYEKTVDLGKTPNLRRAGFVCTDGWVDARGALDDLAKRLPAGWRSERRYYPGEGWKEVAPPTEKEIEGLLNEGLGFVGHAGHGSDDSWAGCFSLATLDRLKNAECLPVMVSCGCSTARFATLPPYEGYVDVKKARHDGTNSGEVFQEPPPPPACWQEGVYNPTGLGEQLLRRGPNGAVAYIGCNTGSQPCGLTLLEGFVTALGRASEPRLGDCWAEAVRHYYEKERLATLAPNDDWYPPSIFFQGMKFMLFGDPSMRMPGGGEAK